MLQYFKPSVQLQRLNFITYVYININVYIKHKCIYKAYIMGHVCPIFYLCEFLPFKSLEAASKCLEACDCPIHLFRYIKIIMIIKSIPHYNSKMTSKSGPSFVRKSWAFSTSLIGASTGFNSFIWSKISKILTHHSTSKKDTLLRILLLRTYVSKWSKLPLKLPYTKSLRFNGETNDLPTSGKWLDKLWSNLLQTRKWPLERKCWQLVWSMSVWGFSPSVLLIFYNGLHFCNNWRKINSWKIKTQTIKPWLESISVKMKTLRWSYGKSFTVGSLESSISHYHLSQEVGLLVLHRGSQEQDLCKHDPAYNLQSIHRACA